MSNLIKGGNFYIITGAPGSGKTTLIEELRKRGFPVAEEAGRQIIREQREVGGDALHTGNQLKFRELMLSRMIRDYEGITEKKKPVFFDRGIPGLIGYSRLIGAGVPPALVEAVRNHPYNKNVFFAPPWDEIYTTDAERKQDWMEAQRTYEELKVGYLQNDYHVIELPKVSVPDRKVKIGSVKHS